MKRHSETEEAQASTTVAVRYKGHTIEGPASTYSAAHHLLQSLTSTQRLNFIRLIRTKVNRNLTKLGSLSRREIGELAEDIFLLLANSEFENAPFERKED